MNIIANRCSSLRLMVFTMMLCLMNSGCGVGVNIYSDDQDIKLGQQMEDQIRKDPKTYPILTGHNEVKDYVMTVGNRVLASSAITKRGIYAYKYEVIHDDSTINAFCTPGGYIYVYTGLLKFIDNEATLAGVLGHEIAHAERRHATQQMTKQYGAQLILSAVLGNNPSQIAQMTGDFVTGASFLAYSRENESEADEYSLKYLSNTMYYPGAVTYFFRKMEDKKGGDEGGSLQRLLSTHPLDQDRIDHVNTLLHQMGDPKASEANLFVKRYEAFKKKLP